MSKTSIAVRNLGKNYILQHRSVNKAKYSTVREEISGSISRLFQRKTADVEREKEETFWALKNVSFNIEEGEAVGFIGHNGAGKSTLLKLLSRITEPTTGEIEITGRVASLLEVGTGFHPELTGRENIFLKGAICGMKRAEIRAKFDSIVEFAEIEQFLDLPVKRYSSGMYVKLGFSVAAHLDPEILIVDEALAVGDVAFQKKCLNRMQKLISTEGKAVLFVSHNLALIQTLCSRALVLRHGEVIMDGPARNAVGQYLHSLDQATSTDLSKRTDRTGVGGLRLKRVDVCTADSYQAATLSTGRPARFVFHLNQIETGANIIAFVADKEGHAVASFSSMLTAAGDVVTKEPIDTLICEIKDLPLIAGRYRLDVWVKVNEIIHDRIVNACSFDVEKGDYRGRIHPFYGGIGSVCIEHYWTVPEAAVSHAITRLPDSFELKISE